jgi:hypothetical protein
VNQSDLAAATTDSGRKSHPYGLDGTGLLLFVGKNSTLCRCVYTLRQRFIPSKSSRGVQTASKERFELATTPPFFFVSYFTLHVSVLVL